MICRYEARDGAAVRAINRSDVLSPEWHPDYPYRPRAGFPLAK